MISKYILPIIGIILPGYLAAQISNMDLAGLAYNLTVDDQITETTSHFDSWAIHSANIIQCPVGSVYFTSQAQIDNFPNMYPGCTTISDSVTIDDQVPGNITNLNGLSQITEIEGSLTIGLKNSGNFTLTSLDGLSSLTSVGEDLMISSNNSLSNLVGLSSLTSVGGDLFIINNGALTNLSGLSGLTSLVGSLSIWDNYALTTLHGLDVLASVGGGLFIYNNDALTNLSGLSGITTINGLLYIDNNDILNNIDAIKNINPAGINNTANPTFSPLTIQYNPLLSECDILSVCSYLSLPGSVATIVGNGANCVNRPTVETACATHCLEGGITFTSQAQIDAFITMYAGCTKIWGNVVIDDVLAGNITNLNGLALIKEIDGYLRIYNNAALTNLLGLGGLTFVGGHFSINNNAALTNLSGLSGLTSLSALSITNNDALTNLSGLSGLTSVDGALSITNNDALTNLSGLSGLTSVGGDLSIKGNIALTNLSGLSGLTSIGGFLWITNNATLTNVSNLSGLTSLGGYLSVANNASLTNLSGLSGLTSIGGYLEILNNDALTNLSGLNGLTSIDGYLSITNNNAMINLMGLSGLTSISGYLYITGNVLLNSIEAIKNINPDSINNTTNPAYSPLTILDNPLLSECDILSVCNYLAKAGNVATVSGNGGNCVNRPTVETACATHCLQGGITFTSQAQIDAFPTTYSGCTKIWDNVIISEAVAGNITNLNGLAQITEIAGGYLQIFNNDALTNISGLSGLTSLDGYGLVIFSNDALTNLSGLDNLTFVSGNINILNNATLANLSGLGGLTSIGGHLWIYSNAALSSISALGSLTTIGKYIDIHNNSNLTNLSGLDGLTTINGFIHIRDNEILDNISGIKNINPAGINNTGYPSTYPLWIIGNSLLSECNIKSVCEYLALNASSVSISDNGTDCDNNASVIALCSCSTAADFIATGPTSICDVSATTLAVNIIGGTGPFIIGYTEGGMPNIITNYVNGSNIPISPPSNTTYTLSYVKDAFNCYGSGNTGMPVINIIPFTTIGNGNFSDPTIWQGGCVPPLPLPEGKTITIKHNVVKN